jgi:subtilase family serine protease
MRRTRTFVLTVLAVICIAFIRLAAAPPSRTTLSGSVPSWAQAANRKSAVNAADAVVFRLYLPWRGGDAASAFAISVSTPGSVNAGQFLSPTQFRSQFSPTSQDMTAVTSWLKQQGFSIGYTPSNRHFVEAAGTVGQAAAAFSTTFSVYSYAGAELRSPESVLSVPASLPALAAIVGLDESDALVRRSAVAAPPPDAFVNARPCSTFWGEKPVATTPTTDGVILPASPSAFGPCGYAGAQLQGVYGLAGAIAGGTDGRGVTVAVIDAYASPTIVQDIETYSSLHGLPSTRGLFRQVVAPGTFSRPQNKAQDPQGWSGEETLDIEAVHTMAPGASIVYVGAPNNYQDLDSALNHVVDQHLADIVTNSYGFSSEALPRGFIKPYNDTLIQAAAEGISVLFSSGDSGDETFGVAGATPTPDWPASSPWVTAVGGTSLGVSAADSRVFELGWQTTRSFLQNGAWGSRTYLYGSGGGTSRLFTQPAYQAGVVPDTMAKRYGAQAMRVVPDISAVGDPTTGMLIGQTQTFPDGTARYSEYRIGGTSLSSPLAAGMLALAVQRRGEPLGFANPALYAIAHAGAYYDITKTDLGAYPGAVRSDFINGVDAAGGYRYTARWFDEDAKLTIHVRPGYDDVTGLGSPNGEAWLSGLSH